MMRIRALEQSLAQAVTWSRQAAQIRSSMKGLPAAELQFIESVLHQTQEAITQCQHQKLAEEQRATELRTAYLQARRERKTVSTLRANALQLFEAEQFRSEQNDLDEVFLGKLVRSRNAAHLATSDATPELNP
jgi:flagellar export protein FliJ